MSEIVTRSAIVTGGGKGIGRAVCLALAEQGVNVAVNYAGSQSAAEEPAVLCREKGVQAMAVQADVAQADQVEALFAKATEAFGRLDILVNNAGITRDAMFHKMTAEQWEKVINVDLNSVFYCTSQVVGHMKEQKYGKIVSVASAAAFGNVGQANYGAAKAGIIGLTKTLAKELARYNITANAMAPGLIGTDIIKTIPDDLMVNMVKAIPAQRIGQPEEVAAAASFLASDDSSYVNGNVLILGGGAWI